MLDSASSSPSEGFSPISEPPLGIMGIDFSTAKQNGDTLWMTQGAMYQGQCHIASCESAREKFALNERAQVLVALRHWLTEQPPALVGVDVAFGVPDAFISEKSWEKFVSHFNRQYRDADTFRADYLALAETEGLKELKRETDKTAKTPFSPYNLRLYRQTYYWLSVVLYPLVSEQLVSAIPMMTPQRKNPGQDGEKRHLGKQTLLVEVCPAAWLKFVGLYQPYKGKTPEHLAHRKAILKVLRQDTSVLWKDEGISDKALGNATGDALDSLICAYRAAALYQQWDDWWASVSPVHRREGRVFV